MVDARSASASGGGAVCDTIGSSPARGAGGSAGARASSEDCRENCGGNLRDIRRGAGCEEAAHAPTDSFAVSRSAAGEALGGGYGEDAGPRNAGTRGSGVGGPVRAESRGQAPPADVQAMRAAQAWVKNPSPEAQKAAVEAAERTDFQGPGAWAAKAVAWTGDGTPSANVPNGEAGPRLPAQAVSASVLLASSLFARPEFAMRNLSAIQMPAINAPSVSGALQANLPQVSGAIGQLQTGMASAQSLSAMAASGQLPAALAAAAAAKLNLPSVGGAVSLPTAGTTPDLAIPGVAGLAAAVGSAPVLPSGSLPGVAVPLMPTMPTMQAPAMGLPGQPAGFTEPRLPQGQMPVVPPAVLAFMFGEQQAFIGIGLDIASGKTPAV